MSGAGHKLNKANTVEGVKELGCMGVISNIYMEIKVPSNDKMARVGEDTFKESIEFCEERCRGGFINLGGERPINDNKTKCYFAGGDVTDHMLK